MACAASPTSTMFAAMQRPARPDVLGAPLEPLLCRDGSRQRPEHGILVVHELPEHLRTVAGIAFRLFGEPGDPPSRKPVDADEQSGPRYGRARADRHLRNVGGDAGLPDGLRPSPARTAGHGRAQSRASTVRDDDQIVIAGEFARIGAPDAIADNVFRQGGSQGSEQLGALDGDVRRSPRWQPDGRGFAPDARGNNRENGSPGIRLAGMPNAGSRDVAFDHRLIASPLARKPSPCSTTVTP